MMESKHLEFQEAVDYATQKTRKTKIYNVVSKGERVILGHIYWYSRWRQYCFFPQSDCVWSHDCLQDLSIFIKELMDERRAKK